MKVKDRMTTRVITVDMETNINEAFRLMKENDIRRLPVFEKGKLKGIITLTDLNQASPSSATSLSIHELNYLLAKTKIKDIVPKKQKVLTVSPDTYIETAAKIMLQNTVSGLPVLDNDKLVGIITETDLFASLIDILGVNKPHTRIDLFAEDRPGVLADITGLVAKQGVNILNAVVFFDKKANRHKVILRIEDLKYEEIVKEFKNKGYDIESVIARDHTE
ncbi:MAG TPA: CBS and ACT domain-containing protein [Syntrophomonadaceae bacterium]|nr:CBS and ACT domain-containing protein [Syntrophomonadaceae bacterium]